MSGAKLAAQLPEPGRFWIRYVPKSWEPPERPWVNLAAATLGDWGRGKPRSPDLAALAETPLDDVLYLPPVPPRRVADRDRTARDRLMGGTPVLVQLLPGEESTVPPVAGAAFVFDLLHALLERDLGVLRRLPAGATAVWPLIPGLTDDPALWELGCRDLAAAGVRCAQAQALTLTPADRRLLADRWGGEEGTFDALFHREPRAERDFARVAHRHGLAPFLPRPLPRPPVLGAANRRIGGDLALAAEVWLRLGRPIETGQALYRDARWVDRSTYDLEGLARERNLGVLPLSPLSREIVAEHAEEGEPARLVRSLIAEYLAPEEDPGDVSRRMSDAQSFSS
ncbi:MAG TPA: hypothetical protein VGM86_19475 [Thermoanaerobaculia bacterium]